MEEEEKNGVAGHPFRSCCGKDLLNLFSLRLNLDSTKSTAETLLEQQLVAMAGTATVSLLEDRNFIWTVITSGLQGVSENPELMDSDFIYQTRCSRDCSTNMSVLHC